MNRAALLLALACTACGLHGGQSPRQLPPGADEQMQQAMQMMQGQMEGVQDLIAGKDTPAARAYKQQAEALAAQAKQREQALAKDPGYVKARQEEERRERELLRRNPSGVETEFKLTDAEEAELGFGMAEQFLSGRHLVADEALQRYVNVVGVWLSQQSERPDLPWRFAVIEGEAPNAFAVPGGYVFITQGLLALAQTESELAGILGHEIAHVVRKHHLRWIYMNKDLETSVRRAEQDMGKADARSRLMFQQMGKAVQSSIERMNSPEMRANLSKSEEFEADTDGAILAWRAGYEAWGLVAVLQRFEAATRNQYATGLTGHPEPLQRFKVLDAALRSRSESDTLGEQGGERFQAAIQAARPRSG